MLSAKTKARCVSDFILLIFIGNSHQIFSSIHHLPRDIVRNIDF